MTREAVLEVVTRERLSGAGSAQSLMPPFKVRTGSRGNGVVQIPGGDRELCTDGNACRAPDL